MELCVIEVGTHVGPYWIDKNTNMRVCDRHKLQYEERPDLGPYDWVYAKVCIGCGTTESDRWWKCCPTHCSEKGPDIVCDSCRYKLHAPRLVTRGN